VQWDLKQLAQKAAQKEALLALARSVMAKGGAQEQWEQKKEKKDSRQTSGL
jgi:BRCT domain type II-containing protein